MGQEHQSVQLQPELKLPADHVAGIGSAIARGVNNLENEFVVKEAVATMLQLFADGLGAEEVVEITPPSG